MNDQGNERASAPADAADAAFSPGTLSPEAVTDVNDSGQRPVSSALHGIGDLLSELRTYGHYYLTAQTDRVKVVLRNVVLYAALGLVVLLTTLAFAVSATVLLLIGAAHGLGTAFGPGMEWLGQLIVGVVGVGAAMVAIFAIFRHLRHTLRTRLEQKYEGLRMQQRVQHGRDAADRANTDRSNR